MHQVLWLLLFGTTQNCLCLELQIPCYDSGWFSAMQFVPHAPEVLGDIKTTIFCNAFCSLLLRLELLHITI